MASQPLSPQHDAPAPIEPVHRDFLDVPSTRQGLFDGVIGSIKTSYPVSNNQFELHIENPKYTATPKYSIADQKNAILKQQSLTWPIKGDWVLKDKQGQEIHRVKNKLIARVPYMTDRGTFIYNGTEWTVSNQQRLRSGAYARQKENGDLENHVNLIPGTGKSFRLHMEPDTGVFKIQVEQSHMPLFPVLRALGASPKDFIDHWGHDLYMANARQGDPQTVAKVFGKLARTAQLEQFKHDPALGIREIFAKAGLDPEVSQRNLGAPHASVDAPMLLAATRKLLHIHQGKAEPDDRDSQANQTVHGPEDLFAERITKDSGRIAKQLLWKATHNRNLNHISSSALTPQLNSVLLTSGLGSPLSEINPVEILDQLARVSRLGDGGMGSSDAIPMEARSVQPSQMGYIDVVAGPESGNIGVDTRAAWGTRKGKDNLLYQQMINVRTGKPEYRSARDTVHSVLAFPGEMEKNSSSVRAMVDGRMTYVPKEKVDYVVPSGNHMFALTTNLIPGLSGIKGGRALMGAKMVKQALPMVNAEAPLVQSAHPDGGSFHEHLGRLMGTVHAATDGIVQRVGRDSIHVRHADGSLKEHELYDNFPFNAKSVSGNSLVEVRKKNKKVWTGAIQDYVSQEGDFVRSIHPVTHQSAWMPITGFIKHRNDKKLYRITTASGRHVVVTEDHSLVTVGDAGQLVSVFPKDCVVGETRLPVATIPNTTTLFDWSYDLGVVAGLYLSEGHIPKAQPNLINIAVAPDVRAAEVKELLIRVSTSGRKPFRNGGSVCLTDVNLSKWLQQHFGRMSHFKFVSDAVLNAPEPFRRGLVNGYMGGDGTLAIDSNNAVQINAYSMSRNLRDGLVRVLASLSVFCSVDDSRSSPEGPVYGFRVISSHLTKLDRWFCYEDRHVKFQATTSKTYRSSPYSAIPVPKSRKARKALYTDNKPNMFVYKTASLGFVAKERVAKFKGPYGRWGRSDVMWDMITDISPVPHEDYVYDFSVGGSENFAVNHGLVVHNTFVHSTPVVKPGDPVTAGQLLAKSNYTNDKGELALGLNFKTGYMPYQSEHGSVAADTHVLWYDSDNQPHFGPVETVSDAVKALALDPRSLKTSPLGITKLWAHPPTGGMSEVITSSGRRVVATDNHSFVTLNDDGQLVESKTTGLTPKVSWIPRLGRVDLPVTTTTAELGSKTLPAIVLPLSADLGFVVGMYLAEGYVRLHKNVDFAVTDPLLRVHLVGALQRLLPHATISDKPQNPYIRVYCSRLAQWLEQTCGKLAQRKFVPGAAFGAPLVFRLSLLAGFWAGDGRVSSKQSVPTDTDTLITSKRLRDGLGLLFASVGISTTHGQYTDAAYSEGVVYRLGISCRDLNKFPTFPHSVKAARLDEIVRSYKGCGSADHVPIPRNAAKAYQQCGRGQGRRVYNRLQAQAKASTANRDDVLRYVPADSQDPALQALRRLAISPIEWDRIESIQPKTYVGLVYDFDMAPLRTFVCVDTLVVHNSNYEDAIVISEAAAKRLTSEHMKQQTYDPSAEGVKVDRNHYLSVFPTKFNRDQLNSIGDDGVVKPGTRVTHGDPLVLSVKTKKPQQGMSALHRHNKSYTNDDALTWTFKHPGVVTDVHHGNDGIKVTVKSYHSMQVGDKLSGAFGDKGVCGAIVPDDQMPRGSDGQPLEVLLNPLGAITRTNPSQLIEAALGKVAAKTGKKYVLPSFGTDLLKYAMSELEKNGLSDTDKVYDPHTRRTNEVFTGNRFLYKLYHEAESKETGRSDAGSYTSEGQPAKTKEESAKRLGLLDMNALISHGVPAVIRDSKLVRGQRNDAYWAAFRSGQTPPAPETPFIYNKWLAHLQGSGVHIRDTAHGLQLMAMRDKDVDQLSRGALTHGDSVSLKDNKPIPGGLFDVGLTGGHHGQNWTHLDLSEPIPNPVMEEPVRRLLGLTQKEFEQRLASPEGTHWFKDKLASLDVDKEITSQRRLIESGRRSKRDEAVKKLGYLTTLKQTGIKPQELLMSKFPVIPPAMRPVTKVGNMQLTSDANFLYQELHKASENLREAREAGLESGTERLDLYNAAKAVSGLGDPLSRKLQEKGVAGLLTHVFGKGSPKGGQFQRRLIGGTLDTVGRAAITPNPTMDMDHVGIPESKAWQVYRPFIMRRLARQYNVGAEAKVPVTELAQWVARKDPRAKQALLDEMQERPVMINRAPVWHRYGYMAAWPKLVKGETLHISPITTTGFGADFNGDSFISCSVPCVINGEFHVGSIESLVAKIIPGFSEHNALKWWGKQTTIFPVTSGGLLVLGLDKDKKASFVEASHISIHTSHGPDCFRVTSDCGLDATFTAHHNFFVLDERCELVPVKTEQVHPDGLIPYVRKFQLPQDGRSPLDAPNPFELTFETGFWFGHYLGDGSITGRRDTISQAACDAGLLGYVEAIGSQIFKGITPWREGNNCSTRWTNTAWVRFFESWGCLAASKQIPGWMVQSNDEFRRGLLAGFIAAEGSVTKQAVRIEIVNRSMLLQFKFIAESFGCICRMGKGKEATDRKQATYLLRISDLKSANIKWPSFPRVQRFATLTVGRRNWDLVPLPESVTEVCEAQGKKMAGSAGAAYRKSLNRSRHAPEYKQFTIAAKEQVCTREFAKWIIDGYGLRTLDDVTICNWISWVDNPTVYWDKIRTVEKVDRPPVTYDFSVPGHEAFAIDGTCLTHNTMNYSVPVSEDAVREAIDKMMPSRNLFSTRDFGVHMMPRQEYLHGLFAATRRIREDRPTRTFASKQDVLRSLRRGEIGVDDPVEIVGR